MAVQSSTMLYKILGSINGGGIAVARVAEGLDRRI